MWAGQRGSQYSPNAGMPGTVRGLGAHKSLQLACAAWVLGRECTEPPLSLYASSAELATVCTSKYNVIQIMDTTFKDYCDENIHNTILK